MEFEKKSSKPEEVAQLADALILRRQRDWLKPWESIEENRKILNSRGIATVQELARAPLPTRNGDWTYFSFGDLASGAIHTALAFGNVEAGSLRDGIDILVRIHSACQTNEIFEAINCECRSELTSAMDLIRQEGAGILVYLQQEGRGTGTVGKVLQLNEMFHWSKHGEIEQRTDEHSGARIDTDRAYKKLGLPSECRNFCVAGEILVHLGLKSIRLLTNNPKKIDAIKPFGIEVTPIEIHIDPENPIIAADLESKAVNLGHSILPEHYRYRRG